MANQTETPTKNESLICTPYKSFDEISKNLKFEFFLYVQFKATKSIEISQE